MKFLLDDPSGKPRARPPMWSELRRRYFQKRYLWPSILLALVPFIVFRLVVFYDITFPFQPPGSIPVTVRSGQRLMQRLPWNNVGNPPGTRLDGKLMRVHKSPLIRPDEDAWITHDDWINQVKSNRKGSHEFIPEKKEKARPKGRQSPVTERPSASGKVVEKFGLPDNENDERGKTDGKKKTRAEEEFAAFQLEKRMAEERTKAAEAEEERARKIARNLEKERKKKNRKERQRKAEERKRANEQREAEEKKVKEEKAAAEEQVAEEKRKAEEEKRTAEQREAEEKKREEEKAAAAQKKAEAKRKEEEEKRAAEQREAEQKKVEEERAAAQAREAEEKRKEEEQKMINDEAAASEERKAEEKRKEEEQKKVKEEKAVAEEREAEERRKEEEEKKAAKQREEEQKNTLEENAAAQGWESDEQRKEGELKTTGEQKEADELKLTDETKRIEEQKQTDEQETKEEDHEDSGRKEDGTVPNDQTRIAIRPGECDLFDGGWEYDPEGPLYTNSTCFYIEGYQDCLSNGRPDSGYLHWKWKPRNCDLPRFDASAFLEAFKGKTIGFVGDSLARNQMQSLLCMLSQVEVPIKVQDRDYIVKWLYEQHQVTLVVIWSPYLLKHSEKEIAGYEDTHSVLYLDVLDTVWTSMLPDLDIIVLSIGQWYFKPSVYIQQDEVVGCHYCPTMNLTEMGFFEPYRHGLRQVLEKVARELKGIAIMSTFAISHFEHGPWESGGDCRREKPLETEEIAIFQGLHDEMHDVVMGEFNRVASDKSKLNDDVHLDFLDVTKVSLLRADGHPGPYRRPLPYASLNPAEWVQNDCLHWCLPGPVDTWNQLLVKIAHRYL